MLISLKNPLRSGGEVTWCAEGFPSGVGSVQENSHDISTDFGNPDPRFANFSGEISDESHGKQRITNSAQISRESSSDNFPQTESQGGGSVQADEPAQNFSTYTPASISRNIEEIPPGMSLTQWFYLVNGMSIKKQDSSRSSTPAREFIPPLILGPRDPVLPSVSSGKVYMGPRWQTRIFQAHPANTGEVPPVT